MAFSSRKVLLACIFLVLLAIGIAAYFLTRKSGEEITTTLPERATLDGSYTCLSAEGEDSSRDACVPGLVTDEGDYYALDFGLMSQTKPELAEGDRITASGIVTPIEQLSTDYWQQFEVKGIFSVTDSLDRGDEVLLGTFRGTLPCADCPGIDTVLTLHQETEFTGGGSYTLSLTYLDRNVEPFVERGEWVVERGIPSDENATVYALYREGSEAATGRYLKVSDTLIRQLMLDGSSIDSGLTYDLIKEGSAPTSDASIEDASWLWTHTDYSLKETLTPQNEAFVLTVTAAGNVTSTTDCNTLSGTAQIDGEVLSFGSFISTKMYCEGSIESIYASDLALVNSYAIEADTLRLNLNRDYGTMYFTRQPSR